MTSFTKRASNAVFTKPGLVNLGLCVVLSFSCICVFIHMWLRIESCTRSGHGPRLRDKISQWDFKGLDAIILRSINPHIHYDTNKDFFCNKCDHDFYNTVLKMFECCQDPYATFLMGGLNNGALADVFLTECKGTIHGFEIQETLYEKLLLKYASETRIQISNVGMSSREDELPITGGGEGAGTYTNFRNETTWDGRRVARVIDLDSYIKENNIQNICMIHIDVEGHEPQVIQGLHINKNSVPIITYELGGTWVDSRHESSWSQQDTAKYFIDHGYKLFLIGKNKMMEVNDLFFQKAQGLNEGFGTFVQGNLLALKA